MNQIVLRQADFKNQDFILLCGELDMFLNRAIGGESKREKYKKYNHLSTMDYVIIAYDEEYAVGCAALRKYSEKEIEVKRVFVREEYRGRNIGGLLLEHLITQAKSWGFERMILETGEFLDASVRLYARYGFEQIENYGAYKNMQESLCMGVNIGKDYINYCSNKRLNESELRNLFNSVGWMSANYAGRMVTAFRKAEVISAYHGDKLIGLVEVLDDGELNAYIHYLLVHPKYQKKGIGAALIERVKKKYKDYLYLTVICEKKENVAFYEKMSFKASGEATPLFIINN